MSLINMKYTEKYGRGIFAATTIKKGTFIECAPVIVIPKREWRRMRESILSDYIFKFDEDKAIALGMGSLYNHSFSPNARYITNIENKSIDFYARYDIHEGEEITVNYNGDPKDQTPIWFDVI